MIGRTLAIAAALVLAGSAAVAQTPNPRPRPMDEATQTRALNNAQLRGTPGYLPAESGIRATNAEYMSPYTRYRNQTAARAGARTENTGAEQKLAKPQ